MASLKGLRLLAKHWPTIFGKAQSYESSFGALEPSKGRPDFIDEATEEMRSALAALGHLRSLFGINERSAKILMTVHVLWGERTRLAKDLWVELYRSITPGITTNENKLRSATLRNEHWQRCVADYQKALNLWRDL